MLQLLKRWTRTEHDICQENLSAFLDGRLTSGERSNVERHLKECGSCRADLESLQETVSLLRTVPAVPLPRTFRIPAGESVRQRQAHQQRLSYGYAQMATAVATLLLVLVVSGDVLLRLQPTPFGAFGERAPVSALTRGDNGAAAPAPTDSTAFGKTAETAPTSEALLAAPPAPQVLGAEAATAVQDATLSETAGAAAEVASQPVAEPLAAPSETLAGPAGALAGPTGAGTALAVAPPGQVLPEPTGTEVPALAAAPPTVTVVPTSTPVPPTLTPVEPWATSVEPISGEAQEVDGVVPKPPSGARAFLEALRPFMSWLEAILALTLLMLLLTLWWLRRSLRPA